MFRTVQSLGVSSYMLRDAGAEHDWHCCAWRPEDVLRQHGRLKHVLKCTAILIEVRHTAHSARPHRASHDNTR